jgi:hypothetical protein
MLGIPDPLGDPLAIGRVESDVMAGFIDHVIDTSESLYYCFLFGRSLRNISSKPLLTWCRRLC